MNCLTCRQPLRTFNEEHLLNQVTYDFCENCGGVWLDKGELEKLTMQSDRMQADLSSLMEEVHETWWDDSTNLRKAHPVRRCRRCSNRTMTKMHFMGDQKIILDYCQECGGLWLDGGEIRQVNEYLHWLDRYATPPPFGRFLQFVGTRLWKRIQAGLRT